MSRLSTIIVVLICSVIFSTCIQCSASTNINFEFGNMLSGSGCSSEGGHPPSTNCCSAFSFLSNGTVVASNFASSTCPANLCQILSDLRLLESNVGPVISFVNSIDVQNLNSSSIHNAVDFVSSRCSTSLCSLQQEFISLNVIVESLNQTILSKVSNTSYVQVWNTTANGVSAYRSEPGSIYVVGGNSFGVEGLQSLLESVEERFYFNGFKTSLRVGFEPRNETSLNENSVGLYSVGFGSNVTASGLASFAQGVGVIASGDGSFAQGFVELYDNGTIIASGIGSSVSGYVDVGLISASNYGSSASGYASTGFQNVPGVILSSGMGSLAHGLSVGTLSATRQGSIALGYANELSTIRAASLGTFAVGYSQLGGTISSQGVGTFATGSVNGGLIEARRTGAFAGGYAADYLSNISASTEGSFAFGFSLGLIQTTGFASFALGLANTNGTILSSGAGALALGSAQLGGIINAGGVASIATGFASVSGTIRSSGRGSFGGGQATEGSILATGNGSLAHGLANLQGYVQSTNGGSFAHGNAISNSNITSAGLGAISIGYSASGSVINAIGAGSSASGFSNVGSVIQSTQFGGSAHGYANIAGTILSSGLGSFAAGAAELSGVIEASGLGSIALGYSGIIDTNLTTTLNNSVPSALRASATASAAIGYNVEAITFGEIAIGVCNEIPFVGSSPVPVGTLNPFVIDENDPVFSIGIGQIGSNGCDSRRTGLMMNKKGDLYIAGTIYANQGNSLYGSNPVGRRDEQNEERIRQLEQAYHETRMKALELERTNYEMRTKTLELEQTNYEMEKRSIELEQRLESLSQAFDKLLNQQ